MTLHYQDDMVTLHAGNAGDIVRELDPGSVQTVVTSPPYYGLRDYGDAGQLGAEKSLGEYVDRMRDVFEGVRQALADDGTVWLNLGDSYTGSWGALARTPEKHAGLHSKVVAARNYQQQQGGRTGSQRAGEPVGKNLLGVPWRVAFALQDDGWFLRSEIIWHKPNPMPESVADRPTKSHEHIFLLAKSARYFYDGVAIREPVAATTAARLNQPRIEDQPGSGRANGGAKTNGPMRAVGDGVSANKRDVWTVPTVPFTDAHFAVYPPQLIRPCILAGSRPGDTVLDPFSGSGTTGMVANQEGRKYVGIDLNPEYLDLSLRTRFAQPTLSMGDAS